jgi:hypothetical protein
MPIGLGAAILGGTSLLGGLISGNAATSAAQTQANAANKANQIEQQQYNQTQQNLAPFLGSGTQANSLLTQLLGLGGGSAQGFGSTLLTANPATTLGAPPTYNMPAFTQKQFQQSPGYQYQLGQTQNATRNAATPGQGDFSGATLKALQQNAAGLSNQDWWNAYNAYTQNYTNQYNAGNQNYWNQYNAQTSRENQLTGYLSSLAGSGQNAAAQLGGFGQNAATQIGQNTIGAGNALAAGQIGSANSLLGGLSGATGAVLAPSQTYQNSLLASLLSGGGAGGINQDFTGSPTSTSYSSY